MVFLEWLFKEILASTITWILVCGLATILVTDFIFIPLAFYDSLKREEEASLEEYPLVSIIVPAHNEETSIKDCVDALLEADYPNKEIIVVNDGSTDGTRRAVEPYASEGKLILINKVKGGKSTAINAGVSVSRGKIIIAIDADTLIQRDAIKRLVAKFKDPKVVAVAGNVKVGNRTNLLTKCQALEYVRDIQIPRRSFDLLLSVLVVPGPLGAYRREALTQVGEYDKDVVTEDFDATVKVLKVGSVVNEPKAIAYTEAPRTLKDLYNQRRRWYGGMLQTVVKHRPSWWRFGVYSFIGIPYLIATLLIVPPLELTVSGIAVWQALVGEWKAVLLIFGLFAILELLTSLFALTLGGDDPRLAVLSPLYVVGYRQLLDAMRLMAYASLLTRRLDWSRARRVGSLTREMRELKGR
ncbi:TPA: glycosyltransferase family 2 protein [Candidatus Bathyarchaeota archaeon]|nr:glycosyltransferase family 2 protein [Candidatus Bathyarchaeota archaeon]